MSDQDKINAVIAAVGTDAALLTLLRMSVVKNIPGLPTPALDAICLALGIDTTKVSQ